MNPNSIEDRGYVELKDTFICEKYGFASVMKWLHNWRASKTSAIDKVGSKVKLKNEWLYSVQLVS